MFAAQASSPPKPKTGTGKDKVEASTAKPIIAASSPARKKRERSSSVEIVEPPEKKPALGCAAAKGTGGSGAKAAGGPKQSKRNATFTRKGAVQTDKKGNGLVTSFFRKEAE